MSANRELENAENDDETEIWECGQHNLKLKVSTDINEKLLRKETWKYKKETTKKPNVQLASANLDLLDTFKMIDTFDRPEDILVEGLYAGTGAYAETPKNEPGKRIPKAGVYAEAGVGRVRAELRVLEAEAKGPNASAGAEANVFGAAAMARAEIGSVSANAGPVGIKLGLGVDTGVSVTPLGVEAKVLGTGFRFGTKPDSLGIPFQERSAKSSANMERTVMTIDAQIKKRVQRNYFVLFDLE